MHSQVIICTQSYGHVYILSIHVDMYYYAYIIEYTCKHINLVLYN